MLAKKFGFGFGIAIILPMLVHYGVSTFSPSPRWGDYQAREDYQQYNDATPQEKKALNAQQKEGQKKYRQHRKVFERNLFFAAAPIGIVAIIIGSFLAVQAIGAGLIFGGIFTLVDGYCWYWSELEEWMRFLSLLIAFIVLLVVGQLKIKNKSTE